MIAHVVSLMNNLFLRYLRNVKQALINNSFANYIIESIINLFLSKLSNKFDKDHTNKINIFHQNQMHRNKKQQEFFRINIMRIASIQLNELKY